MKRLSILAIIVISLSTGAFAWLNWGTTNNHKVITQHVSSKHWIATITETRAEDSNKVTATTLAVQENAPWSKKPQDILGVLNARPIRLEWSATDTLEVTCEKCDVFLRSSPPPALHINLHITDPQGKDVSN